MWRTLWVKLMGAFALVILAGTGLVVLLVSRTTTGQFELYVTRSGQLWAAQLAPTLATYYSRSGSWKGVEAVLSDPWVDMTADQGAGDGWMGDMGMMGDRGSGSPGSTTMMGGMWATLGSRLILADGGSVVVADTAGGLTGTRLPAENLSRGTPIVLGGQTVGTLIVTPFATPATPAGDFLGAVNRAVLWAGLGAGALALVIGSVLFYEIVRPLRSLAAAARGIAEGDLQRRAQTGGRDEVGQVGRAFNQMAETLQRYSLERRNMTADIAHELRTPLSVIQSNLEAMLDGVLPASLDELAALHQETLLLNRLIGDLRTLSLAEAGQLHLELKPVDAAELVQQVTERLRLRAMEKQVTLQAIANRRLPVVQGDPERLAQALGNLVDNALRHTPAGTRVTVEARSAMGGLELAVTDDGPGISAEDLPHLFDRFWRAEKSRNRAMGGSGLGLAIVKQLAEAHGGQVRVVSPTDPGHGTCFSLWLPVR